MTSAVHELMMTHTIDQLHRMEELGNAALASGTVQNISNI